MLITSTTSSLPIEAFIILLLLALLLELGASKLVVASPSLSLKWSVISLLKIWSAYVII